MCLGACACVVFYAFAAIHSAPFCLSGLSCKRDPYQNGTSIISMSRIPAIAFGAGNKCCMELQWWISALLSVGRNDFVYNSVETRPLLLPHFFLPMCPITQWPWWLKKGGCKNPSTGMVRWRTCQEFTLPLPQSSLIKRKFPGKFSCEETIIFTRNGGYLGFWGWW